MREGVSEVMWVYSNVLLLFIEIFIYSGKDYLNFKQRNTQKCNYNSYIYKYRMLPLVIYNISVI